MVLGERTMNGVASKVRQTLTRALSIDSENNEEGSVLGNIFTKFSSHTTADHKKNHAGQHAKTLERKHKTLLVVDNQNTDWAKIFRGYTIHNGTMDIKVEQAALADLQVVSTVEHGASVSIKVSENGQVTARSFVPDFVLIRERIQGPDNPTDHKNFLLGLIHGEVPAVNPLFATYCFMEKPLLYSELMKIQAQFGKERFPLIPQTYYQSYNEMSTPPSLPVVVKIGNCSDGCGKVCVASARGFHDVAGLVAMTNKHVCSEPFLEAKFNIRITKIGQRYKVFKIRPPADFAKGGSQLMEEVALTERYKSWVDECSILFGGLDIVSVQVIHSVDDTETIIEVSDIFELEGEDDLKCIANVVCKRMEQAIPPVFNQPSYIQPNSVADAIHLMSSPSTPGCLSPSVRPESAPSNEFASASIDSRSLNDRLTEMNMRHSSRKSSYSDYGDYKY